MRPSIKETSSVFLWAAPTNSVDPSPLLHRAISRRAVLQREWCRPTPHVTNLGRYTFPSTRLFNNGTFPLVRVERLSHILVSIFCFLKNQGTRNSTHLDERGIIFHFYSVEGDQQVSSPRPSKCGTGKASRLLTLGHKVPPCRIQRVVCTPRNVATVCFTSVIFEKVSRSILGLVIECWEFVNRTHPPESVADDQLDQQSVESQLTCMHL